MKTSMMINCHLSSKGWKLNRTFEMKVVFEIIQTIFHDYGIYENSLII